MVCVRTYTSGTVHMANAPQIHLMAEVSSSLCKPEPDWGSDATGRRTRNHEARGAYRVHMTTGCIFRTARLCELKNAARSDMTALS